MAAQRESSARTRTLEAEVDEAQRRAEALSERLEASEHALNEARQGAAAEVGAADTALFFSADLRASYMFPCLLSVG